MTTVGTASIAARPRKKDRDRNMDRDKDDGRDRAFYRDKDQNIKP